MGGREDDREGGGVMWPFRPKPLGRVAVLELRPNDRVVMETSHRLTNSRASEVREDLAETLGIDVDRVLIVYNATLKVLREGEPPPPPVILDPGRWV